MGSANSSKYKYIYIYIGSAQQKIVSGETASDNYVH